MYGGVRGGGGHLRSLLDYLCGLSYAKFKDKYKEHLAGIASDFYTTGFQISLPIFLLDISFALIYYTLNEEGLWGKILSIIINFLIVIGTIQICKKCFEPKSYMYMNNDIVFYGIIGIWIFVPTLFIISEIFKSG
jgi:hypothetical protein